jgi:hypothetical protein
MRHENKFDVSTRDAIAQLASNGEGRISRRRRRHWRTNRRVIFHDEPERAPRLRARLLDRAINDFRVGELVMLHKPDSFSVTRVQLRAIDGHVALVHFSGLDRSERVEIAWLRRA